jgi:hypothetical protein
MKRLLNVRGLGVAVLLLASGSLVARHALATTTLQAEEDGTDSVAMWYLGPLIGNVTGYGGNIYYVSVTLQAMTNEAGPSPTVTFSTNQPLLLSLSPSGGPFACGAYECANVVVTAIAPSFVTAQSPPADYNISVTATWDGDLASNPVSVFINTPYSNTVVNEGQYCSSPGVCNCAALGKTGQTGYATLLDVYARDLFANALVQIPANETLHGQLWLNSGGWTSALGNPTAGTWPITKWNSEYSFPDYYFICSPNPSSLTPPPTSYGTNGVVTVFTETQDYWIGSTTNGSGVCTQVDFAALYADHGIQGGAEIPGYPGTSECNSTYNVNPIPPL